MFCIPRLPAGQRIGLAAAALSPWQVSRPLASLNIPLVTCLGWAANAELPRPIRSVIFLVELRRA